MDDAKLEKRKATGRMIGRLCKAYGLSEEDLSIITGLKLSTAHILLYPNARLGAALPKRNLAAKVFGFADEDDLLKRGEEEARKAEIRGRNYFEILGAALDKIARFQKVSGEQLMADSGYGGSSINAAFMGKISLKSFQTYRDMAATLGLASTESAIWYAATLGDEAKKAEWGKALKVIARERGLSNRKVSIDAGIEEGLMQDVFTGRAHIAVIKRVSDHFGLSQEGAFKEADAIISRLMYREHLAEIVKAYREAATPPLTALAASEMVHTQKRNYRLRNVIADIENGILLPKIMLTAQVLRGFGFKSMHQLINAAGLSEKYPDPAAIKVAATGLSTCLDRILNEAASQEDLSLPMRELAKRKKARDAGSQEL